MQATLNVTEEQKQRLLDARRALIKRVEGIVSERRSAQTAIQGFWYPAMITLATSSWLLLTTQPMLFTQQPVARATLQPLSTLSQHALDRLQACHCVNRSAQL